MSWILGTVTGHQAMADMLHNIVTGTSVQSVAINAAGTGYSVGDILTVAGGTATITAQLQVVTVGGGGAVTAVRIINSGLYTVNPTTTGNAVTDTGAGSGCTINLTMGTNGWTSRRSTNVGGSGEREVIVEGAGAGSDAIMVGWRTFTDASSGARNFELAGMTGFQSGNTWDNQPGISPGRFSTANDQGCYVPLTASTIDFWVSVSPYRILAVFKIGSNYPSMHLGFLNRFGTAGEYPYPLFVCGTTNEWDMLASSSSIHHSGVSDPMRFSTSTIGPAYVRLPGGVWGRVSNSSWSGVARTVESGGTYVFPTGLDNSPTYDAGDNWPNLSSGAVDVGDFVPGAGNPGTQATRLLRTINSGGDLYILRPCSLFNTGSGFGILGEVDGLFWFDAQGGVVPNDTITVGTQRYRVFQCGARTDNWAKFCVKEA